MNRLLIPALAAILSGCAVYPDESYASYPYGNAYEGYYGAYPAYPAYHLGLSYHDHHDYRSHRHHWNDSRSDWRDRDRSHRGGAPRGRDSGNRFGGPGERSGWRK